MSLVEKNEFHQVVGREIKNWRRRELPSKNIIKGRFCVLELLDKNKHAAKLFEMLSVDDKGESWTYLPYGPFENCNEFEKWIQATTSEPDIILYAILDIKSLVPVGMAGFLRVNPEHGVIEVGCLHYSKLLQRTAAATEAMYLMMKYVFDDLGYRRYEWKCNSLNQASCNAALRLGFKFEGTFRQSSVFKNRNRDTAWFSIIDSEWPEIKARFEHWLDPNNFDEKGQQITKLNEISIK